MKIARSIIEIWMWGGPSQLETFDPKPDAPAAYNNSLKAIDTPSGFRIHQWMPKLAACSELYSVIRTMTHPHNGHETATYLMQTGHLPGGGIVYPAIGALVSSMKRKEYKGDLPPYVILTQPRGRFSETGFLGDAAAPLVTGGNPNAGRFAVDGIVPPGGVNPDELGRRLDLMAKLDRLPPDPVFDAAGAGARKVIFGNAAQTFDLSRETSETRALYGRTVIGQTLLVARRLVEYGVPYIAVNYNGWDISHKRHFQAMPRITSEFDTALSALLTDLKGKGLLDTTLVWASGEFGRTPKIDWEEPWNGGRNHFAHCFSALVAGGGFKGGCAVGVSDETASTVKERPVTPTDFLGSICERAGVDPDGPLPNPKGLKLKVMPTDSPCGRLKEIYL